MKFRKKPVVIEAWQFEGHPGSYPQPTWFRDAIDRGDVGYESAPPQAFTIKTLEGHMRADVGDWIIRGVKGELYPCKPDIFAATYEPVEGA